MEFEEAIKLTLKEWEDNPKLQENENQFISKYSSLFQLENIDQLTSDQFREFIGELISNLPTTTNLEPMYMGHLVKDMKRLKELLKILLDEKIPINDRIKKVRTGEHEGGYFKYEIFSAVLFVSNPKKFSFINDTVIVALEKLRFYLNFNKEKIWDSYLESNDKIKKIEEKHKLDSWQLHWVWKKIAEDNTTKLDPKQKEALSFYYDHFLNKWEDYDKINQERNKKSIRLNELLSEQLVDTLTKEQVTEIVTSLWTGTLFPKNVARDNDIKKIRKSLKYLLYGDGDPFLRYENFLKNPQYDLRGFGEHRVSELLAKVRSDLDIAIVNEPVENLVQRLGYKITSDKKEIAEKYREYNAFVKSIRNEFNFRSTDETDYFFYFINYFSKFIPNTKETLPIFENGEFMFVEEDFNSTTEKKEDSTFLHERFKLLRTALENKLSPEFLKEIYLNKHWSQAGRYLPYHWLGFVPKKVKKPKTEIQFQVDIHSDYFESIVWIDQLAKDKLKKAIEKIEQNKAKFLELIGKLPPDYWLGSHGSSKSWKGEDSEAGKFDQVNLDNLLELMKKRDAEFYIGSWFDKEDTIKQGLQITDTVSQTFENLVPIYEFFSGTKIDGDFFILISYPDSKYADVEGKQYQYDSNKANYTKLSNDSKVILQGKQNDQVVFLGHGTIKSIDKKQSKSKEKRKVTDLIAKYKNYEKFDPIKVRSEQIYSQLKSLPEYGSQPPSILPIPRNLFNTIIGKPVVSPPSVEYSDYEKLLKEKKQIIFYGPPGTGKTMTAIQLAKSFVAKNKSQNKNFEGVLPSTSHQDPNYIKTLTDDQYAKFVLDMIKNEANSQGYDLVQDSTDYHVTLKNPSKEIKIGFRFSSSTKINPTSMWTEIPKRMIDFLSQTEKQNQFLILINNSVKNFVTLPYMIEQKYAKFQTDNTSGRFDSTGKDAHAFKINITEDNAELPARDGTYTKTVYDCSNFVRNIKILFDYYLRSITFHPSYSYEEFVEGIRPKLQSSHISYELKNGIFKEICIDARNDPTHNYLLLIDEINRGNIPKIFGELITLIEDEKRENSYVSLTYSKEPFTVPKNLFLIGTMNTADKSLTQLDIALRRRFSFIELMPDYTLIDSTIDGINLKDILFKINKKIRNKIGRERQIGHSYFMKERKPIVTIEYLQMAFVNEIIPLLQEYFYEDYKKLYEVLGPGFINKDEEELEKKWKVDKDSFIQALGKIPKDD